MTASLGLNLSQHPPNTVELWLFTFWDFVYMFHPIFCVLSFSSLLVVSLSLFCFFIFPILIYVFFFLIIYFSFSFRYSILIIFYLIIVIIIIINFVITSRSSNNSSGGIIVTLLPLSVNPLPLFSSLYNLPLKYYLISPLCHLIICHNYIYMPTFLPPSLSLSYF